MRTLSTGWKEVKYAVKKVSFKLTLKRTFFFGLLLSVPLFLVGFFYIQILTDRIVEKFSGPKWDLPSKVYSDSFQIYPGINILSVRLKERLSRLGYTEVSDEVFKMGEFNIQNISEHQNLWTFYLHDFEYPLKSFKGMVARLNVEENIIKNISIQKTLTSPFKETLLIELEPEVITEFFENAREDRQITKLEGIPTDLLNAILLIEDQRFLDHSGVDPRGIFRALISNIKSGSITQGGSTITQQLIKNFFLTQKKSFIRKINEALMALLVESRYSKDEILETYVNEVYFGQRGGTGIFGVAEAARFYFGKSLQSLTLGESALLAGLIRGPGVYSPHFYPKRALERRNLILKKMLERKFVLTQEYETAIKEPLRVKKISSTTNIAPYFVDFVKAELLHRFPENILTKQGLKVFTSLDPALQLFANEAVAETLKHLDHQFKTNASFDPQQKIQASLIAIQPQTGYIRALVGGRDYNESQFNRITQAKRQPGSLFKPFVLLASLLTDKQRYTLSYSLENRPFEWTYEHQTWIPKNYHEEDTRLTVTLRKAIEDSINIPIARLAREIGIKKIRDAAIKMGIQNELPLVPSLSLGSIEVTPLEMASAYSVLANGGIRATPITIKYIVDPSGEIIEKRTIDIQKVLPADLTFLVNYALEGVLERGTGKGARMFGFSKIAAGKTGTSSDYVDAWFSGYTPDLLALTWVGFDKKYSLGLSGADTALPVWTRFMLKATEGMPFSDFTVPENIVFKEVDLETGLLARSSCQTKWKEAFIEGTEPKEFCPLHE